LREHIRDLLVIWITVDPREDLIERIYIRKKDSDIIQGKEKIANNLLVEWNSEYMNVDKCLEILDYKIDNSGTEEEYLKKIDEFITLHLNPHIYAHSKLSPKAL
jgi:hypothetical protein